MRPRAITLHCTGIRWGTVDGIRNFHTRPKADGGRGWSDIGYHFVITNGNPGAPRGDGVERTPDLAVDGNIWLGRPIDVMGAHVRGHNQDNLGMVLVGEPGKFTKAQLETAIVQCAQLAGLHGIPTSMIRGHYELDPLRTCPGIDMQLFRVAVDVLRELGR